METPTFSDRVNACEITLDAARPEIKKRFEACINDLDGRNIVWSCRQCGRTKPPFPLQDYHLFELETVIRGAKGLDPAQKVKVSESNKYGGVGVFATESIKKGELVTHYPAHTILVCLEDGNMVSLDVVGFLASKSRIERDHMLDYYLLSSCCLKFVGDPNQGRDFGTFCGHLINDGVDVAVFQPLADSVIENPSEENVLAYATCVNAFQSNADFVGCLSNVSPGVPIIALRDIEAGEEITAAYGPGYWLSWRRRQLFPDEEEHDKTIAFTASVEEMLSKYRTSQLIQPQQDSFVAK